MSLVKLGFALLAVGLATMPIAVGNSLITSSTVLFAAGVFTLGIHASKNSERLSGGNRVAARIYQTSAITMPLAVILIRILFV